MSRRIRTNLVRKSKRHPGPADEPLRLDPVFEFIRMLWLLNHALQRASKNMMAVIGLTGPQRMVLRIVGSNPRIAAGTLAETLHVHPGTLSSTLRRLERRGLLARTHDPADKRRVLISLSPDGQAMNQPMSHTIENAIRAALAGLPAKQVAMAQNVLQDVAWHIEREAGDS